MYIYIHIHILILVFSSKPAELGQLGLSFLDSGPLYTPTIAFSPIRSGGALEGGEGLREAVRAVWGTGGRLRAVRAGCFVCLYISIYLSLRGVQGAWGRWKAQIITHSSYL